MDKVRIVKISLTILSILIIVVPLVAEVYAYRDDLVGLVLPPQIRDLMNGGNSNGNSQQSSQLAQAISNFQMPQPVGEPQYDPATGAFTYPFNFTNPLNTEISLNQFSAEVVGVNNTPLGNVSIKPVDVAPGQNAVVTVTGNLSQQAINELEAQYQNGNLDISLKNVNVNVAGISVHIDQISDIGQILANGIPTTTGGK